MKYEAHTNSNWTNVPATLHYNEIFPDKRTCTRYKSYGIKFEEETKMLTTGPNWHEDVEFLYVTEGKGILHLNDNTIPLEKGKIYCVNSTHIHNVSTDNCLGYYCIIFQSSYLKAWYIDINEYVFDVFVDSAEATDLFERLINAFSDTDGLWLPNISVCGSTFVLHMIKNHSQNVAFLKENKTFNIAHKAIKYISENAQKELTVEDICKTIGYSKSHFSKIFKNATGMSIIDFINLTRCKNAQDLLKNSNLKASEIAEKTGFSSVSYFTRTYKKIMGYPPSKEKR